MVKKYSKYDGAIMEKIKEFARAMTKYNDEELIELIRSLMDYPSERNFLKMSKAIKNTSQAVEIDAQLKQRRNGFFVEAGAYDGEELSNSIYFEKNREWTGLLIEMDPFYYLQLIGKNRRAFSINSGISLDLNVNIVTFEESQGSLGKINKQQNGIEPDTKSTSVIPCFPLLSILLAINVTHVDYFSLDVEGFELPILRYVISNGDYKVDSLSVEYDHGDKRELKRFMEEKGYGLVKNVNVYKPEQGVHAADYIFVKK